MKRALSFCLVCVLLLTFTLSGCTKPEKLTVKFITDKSSGYKWQVVASNDDTVKIKESFEKDENDKENGYTVFTITAVKEGEVYLDFACVKDGEEGVLYAATYMFTVNDDLSMYENFHEGTYFDIYYGLWEQ